MEYLYLIIGALLGGGGCWLLSRSKAEAACQKARAELEAQGAALGERLQNREQQVAELRGAFDKATSDISTLRTELKSEGERRAAAESRNCRIPELEGALRDRDDRLKALHEQNTTLKEKISELVTQVQEERKAMEEK